MKGNQTSRAGDRESATVQRESNPPHRILVVDDERDIRRVIVHALMGSGYYVDAAEDGAAAWEALQIKAFNLLITDHNMPKLTGVELVRKLRSARMALPVILATGKLPTEALAQNSSLQLAAMLPKPFSIDELLETVRTVLRATDHAPGSLEPLPDSRSQPSTDGLRV
jgi:DNA-binding response OmpR family regulator